MSYSDIFGQKGGSGRPIGAALSAHRLFARLFSSVIASNGQVFTHLPHPMQAASHTVVLREPGTIVACAVASYYSHFRLGGFCFQPQDGSYLLHRGMSTYGNLGNTWTSYTANFFEATYRTMADTSPMAPNETTAIKIIFIRIKLVYLIRLHFPAGR